jgi:hypothetical protein
LYLLTNQADKNAHCPEPVVLDDFVSKNGGFVSKNGGFASKN